MDGTDPGPIGIGPIWRNRDPWKEAETRDGYDRLEVRIRRGTTIDGAVVALCPAEDGIVTADVCIDGPPVP